MTFRPAAFSCSTKRALSSGSTSEKYWSTPTLPAIALAVRSLSPVIITTLEIPLSFSARIASAASSRSGSSMQITAASSPSTARYRWEYSSGSCSNNFSLPSGIWHFSSSKTKWWLPIIVFFPSSCVEIPCATIYSTFECFSSWSRLFFFAASTTAFAIEWGKCSSRHAAVRSSSSSESPLNETTFTTVGSAFVSVPVLSNTIVSASAMLSKNFPPFTLTLRFLASLIADNTAIGIESFSAQQKSTINTEVAFVRFLVKR